MNRNEFLQMIFTMYPKTFNENNIEIWKSAYETVLKKEWDYEKLFKLFIKEYKKTNIAPAPAELLIYESQVKPPEKNKTIENIKELEKNAIPPPKEFLELKEKLQQKVISNNLKMKGQENARKN